MRKPKRDYWTERGFESREEWCKSRNKKHFEKKCKMCAECNEKFMGNRQFCSIKCTIKGRTKISENKCWEWQGCFDSHGYGLIRFGKTPTRVHRESYKIFKGQIPDKLLICHHCDNPKCCNPEHLFLGSYKDNMQDAQKKNRLYPVGNLHKRGKSWQDIALYT